MVGPLPGVCGNRTDMIEVYLLELEEECIIIVLELNITSVRVIAASFFI